MAKNSPKKLLIRKNIPLNHLMEPARVPCDQYLLMFVPNEWITFMSNILLKKHHYNRKTSFHVIPSSIEITVLHMHYDVPHGAMGNSTAKK